MAPSSRKRGQTAGGLERTDHRDSMTTISDDDIVAYFQRHLVPVFIAFANGAESLSAVVTTFVMSVSDQWLLVTAGHCIQQIEDFTRKHRYKITTCRLMDSMGVGASHNDSIPFVY